MERLLARQCQEDKSLDICSLRSRLRELESLVSVMDPGEGRRREEEQAEGEALELERNLALLTAQYEKAGDECDLEEELGRGRYWKIAVPRCELIDMYIAGGAAAARPVLLAPPRASRHGAAEQLGEGGGEREAGEGPPGQEGPDGAARTEEHLPVLWERAARGGEAGLEGGRPEEGD